MSTHRSASRSNAAACARRRPCPARCWTTSVTRRPRRRQTAARTCWVAGGAPASLLRSPSRTQAGAAPRTRRRGGPGGGGGGRVGWMLQAAAPVDATRVLASFLRALEATVDALARAPSSSALDLDVLPPEEARRNLAWGDGTVRAARVADPLLHRAFERQAARALRGAWCGHGDLWCAGRSGRSAGAPPARPGRRRGCAGRAVRAGGYRDGAGHAGHPEGRRRLPAAGPAPSAGAAAAVGR